MGRKAFTLVELLVVLLIIAILGSLLAFTLPGFQQRSRAAKGGQAVQTWLVYARQRAMYERSPRGVRFYVEKGANGSMVSRTIQYIEQPQDWHHGTPLIPNATTDPLYVVVKQRPKQQPSDPEDTVLSEGQVEPGDYLEVHGTGQVYLIVGTSASNAAKPNVIDKISLLPPGLSLSPTIPAPLTTPTEQYRVMRACRISGDERASLPDEVAIDVDMFTKYAAQAAAIDAVPPKISNGYFDVLFAPNGSVMNSPGSKTILWVRVEKDTEFDHNPTLVVVTTNSGNVSAYDPATAASPFANVK
jgi:prepilin-type N-terminal cleavage/methylation domain-containing protein